jgi:hypothetical protein
MVRSILVQPIIPKEEKRNILILLNGQVAKVIIILFRKQLENMERKTFYFLLLKNVI